MKIHLMVTMFCLYQKWEIRIDHLVVIIFILCSIKRMIWESKEVYFMQMLLMMECKRVIK